LESAFIFGHVGNVADFLGSGWSIEDNYAWAIGYESKLTLPLPGNDKPYIVRFTVHPLLDPAGRKTQRIVFLAGADVLGRFEIAERKSIEFALPVALTAGLDRIELTLVHPDAMRPADFLPTADTRWLALCFHSAGLIQEDVAISGGDAAGPGSDLPTCIVAGNYYALQLARIVRALPSLRGKLLIQYVDTHPALAESAHTRPENALAAAEICWLQTGVGVGTTVQALRDALPAGCAIRRFDIPEMHAFWPFLSADSRAVREPDRYVPARYRFGDRIAAGLTHYGMAEDLLHIIYEGTTEKEMPNLDALLAVDIMNWKRIDSRCDVKLAAYMQAAIRRERVFNAPTIPGPALLRALAERLLDWPSLQVYATRDALLADLDAVTQGFTGRREELPIHPAIAKHFGLAWWQPGHKYRWHANSLTFEEYIADYIRWTVWRP
jgi:hypothetical protein